MFLLISIIKSTFLQNRQHDILISNSKQDVDDFVEELTLSNYLINTVLEISTVWDYDWLEDFRERRSM